MNKLLFLLVGFLSINLSAQIPSNYYDSANGLTGYVLKTELYDIIRNGHIHQGYDQLYIGYETTDTDIYYENDNTVLDMYSENPNGEDPYNFEHGTDAGGNQTAEGDSYNREHLMPQSWFGSSYPMQDDIHHVVPSDARVNNYRGHHPLANVASANWTSLNGSKRGTCGDTGYGGIVFEPIDEFKGDIARIYFYMATRYQNEIGSWENANDGSQPVFDGSNDHVFEDWYLDVLLLWHNQDPVSQRELDRNDDCYDYQGNANPFINHPDWVALIWDPNPDTEDPSAPTNLIASNVTNNSVHLTWTAATDNIGVTSYDIYVNGALFDNSVLANYTASGLTAETAYNFYVISKDAAGNASTQSNIVNETTLVDPTFIISEDFNDCSTTATNFIAYNEASDKDWACQNEHGFNDTGCYQVNGYNEDVASKDWLITTNIIEFSSYSEEKLSVYFVYKYGSTELELLYSTDYIGSGNPTSYTWLPVPNVVIDSPTGTTEGTQQITNVDISGISQDAYLAFKYYSNGSPTRWNVDNFEITGTNVLNVNAIDLNESLHIYPNPTFDTVTLKYDSTIDSISIYTIQGKKVMELAPNKTAVTFDLNKLVSGTYYVRVSSNSNSITRRIIKL